MGAVFGNTITRKIYNVEYTNTPTEKEYINGDTKATVHWQDPVYLKRMDIKTEQEREKIRDLIMKDTQANFHNKNYERERAYKEWVDSKLGELFPSWGKDK